MEYVILLRKKIKIEIIIIIVIIMKNFNCCFNSLLYLNKGIDLLLLLLLSELY